MKPVPVPGSPETAKRPVEDSHRPRKRNWKRTLNLDLRWLGLWILFLIAIALRVYELASHHWPAYLHDVSSHVQYVEYISSHHRLPPVDDDLEYPQQPLYYLLAAPFYDGGKSTDENMDRLAPLGCGFSILALGLIFASLRQLSSWLLRYGLFVFIAFNPAFILASCFVGNDGLEAFFGCLYFYCLLRINRQPRSTGYFLICVGALLGALCTKLNAVALLAAVPWILWRKARCDRGWRPTLWRLAGIATLLTVWSGAMLDRAWNRENHTFVFVHAWIWDYLEIKERPAVYLFSFRFPELIAAGQATTTENTPNRVRFSFPTWEYGNMLLGEFGYDDDPYIGTLSRAVLLTGAILLFGVGLSVAIFFLSRPFWSWRHFFSLHGTALLLVAGSTALLLSYVHSFPNTCNADYRFQSPTFPWMAYGIGRGLSAFPRSPLWRYAVIVFMGAFTLASVGLIALLFTRH